MRFLRLRARANDERGVVAVVVALLMVVLGGSAAMTFDLARLRHERHLVQAAVDLGSLAGAAYLPVSDPPGAALAEATAREIAINNAPQLEDAGLTITFACVVSAPDGNPTGSIDYGFACGPNGGTGTWTNWIIRGGRAYHACFPTAGDLCNTITLSASSSVDYFFAPLIGFETGNTGAVAASACKGFCGQSSSPLDVVLVIDRSRSMSDDDMENLRDAIANPSPAEDSILEFYDPDEVHIGLLALPYKVNGDECGMPDRTQIYPPPNSTIWDIAPIQGGYRDGSTLVMGNDLVQKVLCLQRVTPAFGSFNLSPNTGGHTDHGDPIARAQAMLASQGRPDAPDVIILFADGEANQPGNSNPCNYANVRATNAKNAGATVFTLGYGAAGANCSRGTGRDGGSSPFYDDPATTFLAAAASPFPNGDPSTDDVPNGCGIDENRDGDYYFCEGRGDDLRDVFKRIAIQSLQRSRLLNF